MLEAIIRVLAPHYCIGCSAEDTLLCEACRLSSLQSVPSRCYNCKVVTSDAAVCKKCRRHGPISHLWVGCVYNELPRELIRRYKFQRARAAHKPIVAQLDERLPMLNDMVVSWVPTATSRVRQRGYDQSRLVVQALAGRRDLPCRSLLLRQGQARQVGNERTLRLKQAEQFFQARPFATPPRRVLLIDDVLTTGATLQAAAKCLKQSGVKEIYAAVFAQKN
jgi:ComF family protein